MLIQTQKDLDTFIKSIPACDFITVDTEFLRDKTYFPKLCLIQVGIPDGVEVAIDPLTENIDLTDLFELFKDQSIIKVFHAARQDLEIFYKVMDGYLPSPIFDTQIAASVLGFGAQIGYNNLAKDICDVQIDKSRQFMDWSHRPLSDKQIDYALADVSHLKKIYLNLTSQLKEKSREKWVLEETAFLTDDSLYKNDPEEAWTKIKMRSHKSDDLVVLKELAKWREIVAQKRNIPKQHILRDEVLTQLAMLKPQKEAQFKRVRNMPSGYQKGHQAENLLNLIYKALETPKSDWPKRKPYSPKDSDNSAIVEMLKLLLKIQSAEHDVAANIVASAGDIEKLASDDEADIPALKGWRFDVFGKEAIELKHGRLSLGLKDGQIQKYT